MAALLGVGRPGLAFRSWVGTQHRPHGFVTACCLVLALLFVVPAAAHTQAARDTSVALTTTPEVVAVEFKGTKVMSAKELQSAITTKASSCKIALLKYLGICKITKAEPVFQRRYLDQDEFKRDVVRVLVFYFRRGYRDAKVDTALVRSNSEVRITLTVTEGPPTVVQRVAVRGIGRAIARGDSARDVRPRVGSPLNMLALDSTAARIRARLWEKGYADAQVKPTSEADDSTRVASAEITVDRQRPVTIGEISVVGNDRISTETIRNSLALNEGQLYRVAVVANSQRSLYESALFRRVVIDTVARDSSAGQTDSVKALVVRVIEGPQREARTSFGFTTADFVQAEATFTHNYLFQTPVRLVAGVTVGNLLAKQLTQSSAFADISDIVRGNDLGRYYAPTYQANFDLTRRWFGSPRNTVGAGVFVHRRSSPGVLVDNGYGANATFTRELARRVPFSIRYQFEESRVEAGDVYFCVNYGVCDAPTIGSLRDAKRLSPLSLTISIDRTDIPFSPTRGVLARAEVEHASTYTGSDFHYNRAFVDAAAYHKIGRGNTLVGNTVVAVHVRAGWVNALASTASAVGNNGLINANADILHPSKRFYAGGSQSVRGFGENQLGPRVLTVSQSVLQAGVTGDSTIACAITAPSAQCLSGIKDDDLSTRPLGGTTLLEGGVELRIPVFRSVVAALFLDGAILGNASVSKITEGTGALTPGFGVRYQSPVGPIRVDLGIRPTLQSALPVITEVRDVSGKFALVDLTGGLGCTSSTSVGCRIYPNPLQKQSFINRITNRLTLHLSIGEAY